MRKTITAGTVVIIGIFVLLCGMILLLQDLEPVDWIRLSWDLLSWEQFSWEQLALVQLTSLGELWYRLHPASLNLFETVVARYLWEDLWYDWLLIGLTWPAAAVVGFTGLLITLLGSILWRRRLRPGSATEVPRKLSPDDGAQGQGDVA